MDLDDDVLQRTLAFGKLFAARHEQNGSLRNFLNQIEML